MKDSPDKIERMKAVLADSLPKATEEDRKELPLAARQLLEGSSNKQPEAKTETWWQRVLGVLRGPQLIGLSAVAVVVIIVALQFKEETPTEISNPGGTTFRSGGGEDLPAMLVVMQNLSEEQTKAIQGSDYFKKEQLVVLGADDDLQPYSDRQVVFVDGTSGKITTPFASTEFTESISTDPDELASQILDVLATFTESEE